MKKLLLVSVLFALAIIIPMPANAGMYINAGMSLLHPIVFEAAAEPSAMPEANGAYVVADADVSPGGPTGRDEKQQDRPLEKREATGTEEKSDWKINVWPVQPPDNVKSLPEMKDENKHTPPDRF